MKSGREVGKVMGPLFPRLHVNDADKGGPRAPPRNKMALYEQFSVPSSRLNRSLIPPPSQFPSSSSMLSSASTNQGLPPRSHAALSEELQSITSNGKDSTISRLDSARSSQLGSIGLSMDRGGGREKSRTGSGSSSHNLLKAKASCQKKIDDDNDYSVPIFENHEHDPFPGSKITNTSAIGSSSHLGGHHHPEAHERILAGGSNSRKHRRDGEEMGKSTSFPGYGEESEDVVMMFRVPQNHENAARVTTVCRKSEIRSTISTRVSRGCDKMEAPASDPRVSVPSTLRNVPRPLMLDDHMHQNHEKASSNCRGVKFSQPPKVGVLENDDSDLGSSILDSEPSVEISPDDVFRVMEPKAYWKTRQILRNQQRVFAEQVFELHRVMKVQQCIAASPTTLLEGTSCSTKALDVVEMSAPSSKSRGDELKWQKQNSPCKDGPRKGSNVVVDLKRRLAPEFDNDDNGDDNQQQQPSQALENGYNATGNLSTTTATTTATTATPTATTPTATTATTPTATTTTTTTCADSKHPGAPWSIPVQGNQWLFPVMSPSEGLVYKPFMAPYHPNLGFMPPPYGGCGPLPMLPFPGGTFPIPIPIPMPNQEQNVGNSTNYFMSPHGFVPPRNKEEAYMPPAQQVEGHLPTSGNSSNTHPDAGAFSCTDQKVHPVRDHELQGSITGSSKLEGSDASCVISLGLQPEVGMDRPQVIKAVPHNPRTATASAARIFQSLQKDRQLFD